MTRLAQAYMRDPDPNWPMTRCIHGPVDSVADEVVSYLSMGERLTRFDVDKPGMFKAVDVYG